MPTSATAAVMGYGTIREPRRHEDTKDGSSKGNGEYFGAAVVDDHRK